MLRIRLHEPDQVGGEGPLVLGKERAVGQRAGVLHPRRRAPRAGDEPHLRVDAHDLPGHGDDGLQVVLDGEVAQLGVGLVAVVVGVVGPSEDEHAHRQPHHRQPSTTLGVEEGPHGGALPLGAGRAGGTPTSR